MRDRAVFDVAQDPVPSAPDHIRRPVVGEGIERQVECLESPLDADAGIGAPDLAGQREARPVGVERKGFERQSRESAVDGTDGREPTDRHGCRKDLRQYDLSRPAHDIESDTLDGTGRRQSERCRARERDPERGEGFQRGIDSGECRRIQVGESDRYLAPTALPIAQRQDLDMGVGAFQPRIQRQQAGNPGLVEIDHELGLVRRPGAAGRFVRDD